MKRTEPKRISKKRLDKLGYVPFSTIIPKSNTNQITVATRKQVHERSEGLCEAKTNACTKYAEHIHHIKLRRSKDHSLDNLLNVCNACHTYIHLNPSKSYEAKWLKHWWDK